MHLKGFRQAADSNLTEAFHVDTTSEILRGSNDDAQKNHKWRFLKWGYPNMDG